MKLLKVINNGTSSYHDIGDAPSGESGVYIDEIKISHLMLYEIPEDVRAYKIFVKICGMSLGTFVLKDTDAKPLNHSTIKNNIETWFWRNILQDLSFFLDDENANGVAVLESTFGAKMDMPHVVVVSWLELLEWALYIEDLNIEKDYVDVFKAEDKQDEV